MNHCITYHNKSTSMLSSIGSTGLFKCLRVSRFVNLGDKPPCMQSIRLPTRAANGNQLNKS